MSDLVIVESPAKAKTIKKYLGPGYEVIASMGHVRDLPKSKIGVDLENDFEPIYTDMKGKEDVIKELKKYAKKCDKIYLATDPDREGEAISWHIAQMLDLDLNTDNRVAFNEITKFGVQSGMSNPHKINIDLVNAQQARRILDRILGYKLSPFLWRKVKRGLSAGRVQSVAVSLVVDRENEIRKFVTQEYWSIDGKFTAPSSRKIFSAKLASIDTKKVDLKNESETNSILASLENEEFKVTKVKKRVTKRQPAPPYITSTLQQEASRRMGFQARRTMKAAQELYEGIEIEELGLVGLITYMRTDSLRVSDEAKQAAAEYIKNKYGEEYLPPSPREYKSKKNAQDAHEAIRPSMPELDPERVKNSLTTDQYKIYKLIWERFIASQMANALLDTVSAEINAGNCTFTASGYSVKFKGFSVVHVESKDTSADEEENKELPPLEEGDVLKVKSLLGNQHFTQPPSRYTEATLIKTLEENGIGRPSTYAPTITTITSRMYVERDGKQLKPTVLGEVTTELMKEHFANIVNAKFTASMETSLDDVENGDKDWKSTLKEFYKEFDATLAKAEVAMEGKRVKIPSEETDVVCDQCGRNMVIKIGRFGKFLACPGFPECTNTKKIVQATKGVCPLCGNTVIAQKSKKGRNFFGCEKYPECNFMTWNTPIEDTCPKCGSTLFKKGGRAGKILCEKPGCGYERGL
ncbi:type I DNA topoisomerase [Ruminococcus sp. HUN007]|uniref:type I DNA topoisomerase n=1 Tax=Ruminococcus sp. HUN007 TaxID=1514668 RepID=UPI0005D21847|nr:type I DNA topoisomerase [Ruminococcus sp. HUN007]